MVYKCTHQNSFEHCRLNCTPIKEAVRQKSKIKSKVIKNNKVENLSTKLDSNRHLL